LQKTCLLGVALLCLASSGCLSKTKQGKASAANGRPSGVEDAASGPVAEYRIVAEDVLGIQVKGEKECSGEFEVKPKGSIEFCYLGDLVVLGKTVAELKETITKTLSEQYLNNPQVAIEVKKSHSQSGWVKDSVRIIGEVNRPGIYVLKSGYTVLDVILEAGGFTEFASPNRTRIVRGEGEGKQEIYVKMKEVMKSGDRNLDTYLKPGDTVVVPEGIL
jgi:polysaccharide export outer membrane protein